jgi:hypothetical protein
MPGDLGATVVTTLVCFFISHTRLRVRWAPGIPHALIGREVSCTTRARSRRGNVEVCRQIMWLFENGFCARANARYLSRLGEGRRARQRRARRVGESPSTRRARFAEAPPPQPSPASGRGSSPLSWEHRASVTAGGELNLRCYLHPTTSRWLTARPCASLYPTG